MAATLAGLLAPGPGLPRVPPGFSNGPQPWPPVRFRLVAGAGLGPPGTAAAAGGAVAEVLVVHRTRRDGSFDLEVDGVERRAVVHAVEELDGGLLRLVAELDGRRGAVVLARAGARWSVAGPAGQVDLDEVARLGETAPEAPEGACVAPLPGLVVAVTVEEGAPVARGEVVAVLEAMKLEHRITAPVTGQVAMVLVAPGEQVGPGQVLVQLTPANDLQ